MWGFCGNFAATFINSVCPSDTIWQHRSGSALAPAMACCLMAPSPYLHQCCLIIKGLLYHSPESNYKRSALKLSLQHAVRYYTFEITTTFPRGQWVKIIWSAKLISVPIAKKVCQCSLLYCFAYQLKIRQKNKYIIKLGCWNEECRQSAP